MALPNGVVTATITFGTDVDFAGNAVTAAVAVQPTHDLVWKATGQRILSFPLASNTGSIALPVVDQTGFADGSGNDYTFWAYILTVTYSGATGTKTVVKSVQPLTGQTSLDFDLLPDGNIAAGVTAPRGTVTSIDGQTGVIAGKYPMIQRITTANAATIARPTTDSTVAVWWIGSDATHPPAHALAGDIWDHS